MAANTAAERTLKIIRNLATFGHRTDLITSTCDQLSKHTNESAASYRRFSVTLSETSRAHSSNQLHNRAMSIDSKDVRRQPSKVRRIPRSCSRPGSQRTLQVMSVLLNKTA